ncbi:murein biosynthesis integral membrane protein MurJ [Actinoplanes sp. NPDC051859]|uniref:murein biosynthesis integral membrane protein MurJ n=1 Tax=Actinoplanes sp. NPDC051859 TaxID=3363909 RepID=UPI003787CF38
MTPTRARAGLAGAAAVIAVLTIVARIAGFGRLLVFLRAVGEDGLANVYNAANSVPNVVFELVAGGALASLVVPLLAGAVDAGDRQRVSAVASALLTWVLALTVPLAVLVALLAGPVSGLFHFEPDEQLVVARMLRIFAPQLPLYGIGIVLTGVLQAHHRFAWPVIAPLLSSVTVMGAYLSYALVDGARSGVAGLSRTGELILAGGTTLGVVVLALCLLIPLRRLRLRPTLSFPGDEGRQALRLGWAGAVTVGAQQLVLAAVLSVAADGPLTRYMAAQTVFLLPWAVLAVPVATAVYPRLAAAFARRDEESFTAALAPAARSAMLLACLGAAALAALAQPAAFLISTPAAAPAIVGFAPGLLGYTLFALLSRALYARGATRAAALPTAAGWGLAAVAVLGFTTVLDGPTELAGLGAANAIGMSVIGLLLVLGVRRHAGPEALSGLLRASVVGIVAAAVAGGAGWGVVAALRHAFGGTPGVWGSLLQGMLGGVVVAVAFAAVVHPFDRRYLRSLVSKLPGRDRT